ncbi:MAG: helix-turn-helix transcriptional regulator [Clostridia bacterium]|nr:helix-turn-helix transcriptional regulator [Clostridia bacterium]
MTIGKRIKELRHKNGVTQDKLAEYLGVTYQAVSKWERDVTSPDVTMLVPIATFFGIDLNELFDFDGTREQTDVEAYIRESNSYPGEDNLRNVLAVWRRAAAKYPRNFTCLSKLAWAVYINALYSDPAFGGATDATFEEAETICKRIIDDCTDDRIRTFALSTMVKIYSEPSSPLCNEAEALRIADILPGIQNTSQYLRRYALRNNYEKREIERRKCTVMFMHYLIENLSLWGYGDAQTQICSIDAVIALIKAILSDGNYLNFNDYMAGAHINRAVLLVKLGKLDEAMDDLHEARRWSKEYEKLPEGKLTHSSPLVKGVEINFVHPRSNATPAEFILRDLERDCFSPLFKRDDYKTLIGEIRQEVGKEHASEECYRDTPRVYK